MNKIIVAEIIFDNGYFEISTKKCSTELQAVHSQIKRHRVIAASMTPLIKQNLIVTAGGEYFINYGLDGDNEERQAWVEKGWIGQWTCLPTEKNIIPYLAASIIKDILQSVMIGETNRRIYAQIDHFRKGHNNCVVCGAKVVFKDRFKNSESNYKPPKVAVCKKGHSLYVTEKQYGYILAEPEENRLRGYYDY